MKNTLKVLILATVLANTYCAPNMAYFKDTSYYNKPLIPGQIYLFPIPSIEFDDAASDYIQQQIDNSMARYEHRLLRSINNVYLQVANKNIKKSYAIVMDTVAGASYSITDRSQYTYHRVFDKSKDTSLMLLVPDQATMDLIGVHCDYAMFIIDLKITMSSFSHRYIIPTPIVVISGQESGPAFELEGKYIVWDYKKGRPVCAGLFKNKIDNGLNGGKEDSDKLEKLFINILNRAPFWSINYQELN